MELSTEPSITLSKPSAGSEIDIETFQPSQCVWLLSSTACQELSFLKRDPKQRSRRGFDDTVNSVPKVTMPLELQT